MMEDCIFCKLASGEIDRKVIYENDNFISFPDANPRVEGHTLIVPKKHFVNILDLPKSLGMELLDAIKNTAEILLKEHKAEGFSHGPRDCSVYGLCTLRVSIVQSVRRARGAYFC